MRKIPEFQRSKSPSEIKPIQQDFTIESEEAASRDYRDPKYPTFPDAEIFSSRPDSNNLPAQTAEPQHERHRYTPSNR